MERPDPQLTIAVPFGGGVDYLRLTLRSIFAQRSKAWIALLINNANEPERSAARDLAAEFDSSRLRYVEHESQIHPADNFNACIDLAQTDLVASVHADDEISPDFTDVVLGIAGRQPRSAAYFLPWRVIGPDSKPRGSFVDWYKRWSEPRGSGELILDNEEALCSLLRGNWINGSAICFHKSRLNGLRWDRNLSISSDLDLWSRILLSGRTMAGPRGEAIYLYRRHPAQVTQSLTANLDRFIDESMFYDKVAVEAEKHGWRNAAKIARAKRIIKLYLAYVIAKDIRNGSFQRARKEIQLLTSLVLGRTNGG